jgi:uncharacterized iron-regulated membrane protein
MAAATPYRAMWQRWHLWLGLSAGLLAFTWCLSGFLSDNPWQLFGQQGAHGKSPSARPATSARHRHRAAHGADCRAIAGKIA